MLVVWQLGFSYRSLSHVQLSVTSNQRLISETRRENTTSALNNATNWRGPMENDSGQTAVSTAGNYRIAIRVAINHASVYRGDILH